MASTEQQLHDARILAATEKLYWVVGIAGLGTLACVALAIFLPSFRRWAVAGALACMAVAALAVALVQLLPYLLPIGCVVLLLLISLGVWYWRQDAKSRDQIVSAVNTYKEALDNNVEGWREHFRKYIDSGSDRVINKTRARLRLDPVPEK